MRNAAISLAIIAAVGVAVYIGVSHRPVPAPISPTPYTTPLPSVTPSVTPVPSSVVLVSTITARCHYQFTADGTALSDPQCTPGSRNPNLSVAMLCSPSFRTAPYRTGALAFPAPITALQKTAAYTRYGVSSAQRGIKDPRSPSKYLWEVDHILSLEDLGDDEDANLWPQPSRSLKLSYDAKGHLVVELLAVPTNRGYEDKDVIENRVHADLCSGTDDAARAQAVLTADWPQQLQGVSAPGKSHTSDDEDSSP